MSNTKPEHTTRPAPHPGRALPLNQRILLTTTEAAQMLGISPTTFRADVAPELRPVVMRRRQRWPTVELERWVATRMEPAPYD